LDARVRWLLPVEPPGFDAVDGLVRPEVVREALEAQYVAAGAGNEKHGRAATVGLYRDDRRPIRVVRRIEQVSQLGDGWSSKQRGQRQAASELFLERGKQSYGEQ